MFVVVRLWLCVCDCVLVVVFVDCVFVVVCLWLCVCGCVLWLRVCGYVIVVVVVCLWLCL